jgi:hypothetical protein
MVRLGQVSTAARCGRAAERMLLIQMGILAAVTVVSLCPGTVSSAGLVAVVTSRSMGPGTFTTVIVLIKHTHHRGEYNLGIPTNWRIYRDFNLLT